MSMSSLAKRVFVNTARQTPAAAAARNAVLQIIIVEFSTGPARCKKTGTANPLAVPATPNPTFNFSGNWSGQLPPVQLRITQLEEHVRIRRIDVNNFIGDGGGTRHREPTAPGGQTDGVGVKLPALVSRPPRKMQRTPGQRRLEIRRGRRRVLRGRQGRNRGHARRRVERPSGAA